MALVVAGTVLGAAAGAVIVYAALYYGGDWIEHF